MKVDEDKELAIPFPNALYKHQQTICCFCGVPKHKLVSLKPKQPSSKLIPLIILATTMSSLNRLQL